MQLFVDKELELDQILNYTRKLEEKDINFKVNDVSDDILSINLDDLKMYFDEDAFLSATSLINEKQRLMENDGSAKICSICNEPEIPYRKLTNCEKCKVNIHQKCRI